MISKTHSEKQNKDGLQRPLDQMAKKRYENPMAIPGNVTVAVWKTEDSILIENDFVLGWELYTPYAQ